MAESGQLPPILTTSASPGHEAGLPGHRRDDRHTEEVSLVAYGRPLGTVMFTHRERVDDERRALLAEVGERCGQALERALLYAQQHTIATALQASLLPARLPDIPGIALAARYQSGTRGMSIGGDFYDVFSTPSGWVAIIGDVCGKGAEAAALTSLARHTARAEARHDSPPERILAAVNHAACVDDDEHLKFLTAVCARLYPSTHGLTVAIASGGHPPPLIMRRDGTVDPLPTGGPLLGVQPGATHTHTKVQLKPTEPLGLYTNGIIEARRQGELFGDGRLTVRPVALAVDGASPRVVADSVIAAVFRYAGKIDDDMAVLVLQAQPEAGT